MKSLLFVPGKEKMLGKIQSFNSDAFIIDLEDSIADADKSAALDVVCAFLETNPCKTIFVRVNGNRLKEELPRLSAYDFDGYMIPKFERPELYADFLEYFKGKEIIALVETPQGLINIKEIASCSFVNSIAFGAEDFTSSIGMKNCQETLYFSRSQIVVYSKAFGKKAYDTPSFVIDNVERLENEIQTAVDLGFDGKMAIHPNQTESINRLFQMYDIEYMERIVDLYDRTGEAVLRVDNVVFEKMHIAHFKRIIKEHYNK